MITLLENIVYLEHLRRGYEVYIGKVDEYEKVAETLKDNDNKTLERELRLLRKIEDNYEKIILTSDKMPLSNEEGIIVRNVLEWLLDK